MDQAKRQRTDISIGDDREEEDESRNVVDSDLLDRLVAEKHRLLPHLLNRLTAEEEDRIFSTLQQRRDKSFLKPVVTKNAYPFSGLVYDKTTHKVSFTTEEHTTEIVPFRDDQLNIGDEWAFDRGGIRAIQEECMDDDQLSFEKLAAKLQLGAVSTDPKTKFSESRLKVAVQMCNVIMQDHDCPDNMSEMFLQQISYTAYSALIMAAAPEIILSHYIADQMMSSSMTIRMANETEFFKIDSKPDAAATIRDKRDAFVIMELKPEKTFVGGTECKRDYDKCIITTAVTALMLKECGVNQSDIAVPFLIGRGKRASLYVTCIDNGRPVVKQVQDLQNMDVATFIADRSKMFVGLALLLKGIKRHFTTEKLGMLNDRYRDQVEHVKSAFSTQKSTNKSEGASANKSSRRSVPHENVAVTSLSNLGIFTQITSLPTANPRIRAAFLTSTTDNRSRFYFKAIHADSQQPVFLKVWNAQRDVEDVCDIKEELKLLKCAQLGGVSVPKPVFDEVLECFADNGERFLLIATEYVEPNQKVLVQDLALYAAGLIENVRKLHSCGVVHCDIKPNNVLWDSEAKVVKLIDFGHAQWEAGARSYRGTEGFTAPEVENGKAHSRQSDAFSVGKTLLRVTDKAGEVDDTNKLRESAVHLSARDLRSRWSLDAVSEYLLKTTSVGVLAKKSREEVNAGSTGKLADPGCFVRDPAQWLSESVQ